MHRIFAGMAVWATIFLVGEMVLGLTLAHTDVDKQGMLTWHMLLGVFVGIYICILHVMIMFHFIGSGKEVKQAIAVLGGDAEVIQRLRRFKMLVFPAATFAPILVGASVILGGGAHTGALPGWIHWSLGLAGLALNLYAFPIQYRALVANLELLHEVDERLKNEAASGTSA